jgi:hypothetical protein
VYAGRSLRIVNVVADTSIHSVARSIQSPSLNSYIAERAPSLSRPFASRKRSVVPSSTSWRNQGLVVSNAPHSVVRSRLDRRLAELRTFAELPIRLHPTVSFLTATIPTLPTSHAAILLAILLVCLSPDLPGNAGRRGRSPRRPTVRLCALAGCRCLSAARTEGLGNGLGSPELKAPGVANADGAPGHCRVPSTGNAARGGCAMGDGEARFVPGGAMCLRATRP